MKQGICDFAHCKLISNTPDNKILKKTLYRENTNVFTYYILKMILLFNYDSFLFWCKKNNSSLLKFRLTSNNLNNFYQFVKSKYKSRQLKNFIDNDMAIMYKNLNSKSKFPYKQKIIHTARMTICETKLN